MNECKLLPRGSHPPSPAAHSLHTGRKPQHSDRPPYNTRHVTWCHIIHVTWCHTVSHNPRIVVDDVARHTITSGPPNAQGSRWFTSAFRFAWPFTISFKKLKLSIFLALNGMMSGAPNEIGSSRAGNRIQEMSVRTCRFGNTPGVKSSDEGHTHSARRIIHRYTMWWVTWPVPVHTMWLTTR